MASSITIDNLDAETAARLQAEAFRRGLDIKTLAAELLKKGLGSSHKGPPGKVQHALTELAGTWSDDEATEFLSLIADFENIKRTKRSTKIQ